MRDKELQNKIIKRFLEKIEDKDTVNMGRLLGYLRRSAMEATLIKYNNNKSKSAEVLGINRDMFYRHSFTSSRAKLRKYSKPKSIYGDD